MLASVLPLAFRPSGWHLPAAAWEGDAC